MQTEPEAPQSVTWFVRLSLLTLAVGALMWTTLVVPRLLTIPAQAIAEAIVGLVFVSFVMGFMVGLVRWAGDGQNWARWTLLMMTAGGWLLSLKGGSPLSVEPLALRLLFVLQWVTQTAAMVLAFLPSSSRWYRQIAMARVTRSASG